MGREQLLELQLSVPTPYPVTVRRRVLLIIAASTAAATVLLIVIWLRGQWQHPATGPAALLVPLGPAVLLIGIAAWGNAVMRSTAAASLLVLAGWLFEVLLWNNYVALWLVNRAVLLVGGAALVVAALRRLRNSEALLLAGVRS